MTTIHYPNAEATELRTADGLTIYDLEPQAAVLVAVAGPAGHDPRTIDDDDLPEGFRWVGPGEWADACERLDDAAFIAQLEARGFTTEEIETIAYDWANKTDHRVWALTAELAHVREWIETVNTP